MYCLVLADEPGISKQLHASKLLRSCSAIRALRAVILQHHAEGAVGLSSGVLQDCQRAVNLYLHR